MKEDLKNRASHALGYSIGANLKQQGITELEIEAFAKGIVKFYAGQSLDTSPEETNALINEYITKLNAGAAKEASAAGMKFLAENANKAGITVLASGLQYEVLTEGNGPKPSATDTVTTHYHGTLIDGTVFDSSVQRGTPASFPVNGVIQGWVEALQLMPTGSKWRLFVPSDLAYGDRGAGPTIGPGTTLIFEVELISIN